MQFPIVCLILSLFIHNRVHASGIAAGILTLANIPLLTLSYHLNKSQNDVENTGSVKRAFLFTFHPRSNLTELVWMFVLTPGYAFLLTYKMDWGMFYMAIFSSYSMTGEPIPEITPYLTNKDFHLLSHHYQRVYY